MVLKKNNLLYLFSCMFIFSTCSTVPATLSIPFDNDSETSFFSSFPTGEGIVFIGVAEKRSNPKETVKFALESAAQRVAVFYRISGEFVVEHNIGSGAFDYLAKTHTRLYADKEQSKQYVEALQYDADTDSLELENSFLIRTVYKSTLPYPVNYRPKYAGVDRKPDWVDNPPDKIEGYEMGIGFSGRYSSFSDTITNSWYNAVFAIIRNINTSSQSNDLLYQNTNSLFGYKTSNDNKLYSFGALCYFYVLDTWIDPKTKSVWTLAIANKSN